LLQEVADGEDVSRFATDLVKVTFSFGLFAPTPFLPDVLWNSEHPENQPASERSQVFV
jgi:hypothetical protein